MSEKVKEHKHWMFGDVPQVEVEYEDGTVESFAARVYEAKVARGEFVAVRSWSEEGATIG